MSNVKETWGRIQTWLEANVESLAKSLPGPASEEDIAKVEAEIGFRFPDQLRESYLTQNGVEYGEEELNIFATPPDDFDDMAFCLLPIEMIADEWKVWKELIDGGDFEDAEPEPDEGIANTWWSDGWIPVAGNGGGDFLCVDVKPAEGGQVGQVIGAWHDMDERKLIAKSWAEYLSTLADDMESGKLSFSEDEGLIYE